MSDADKPTPLFRTAVAVDAATPPLDAPKKVLSDAAKRALAEAEERRKAQAAADNTPKEVSGRGGLDPARYKDWEVGGIAVDF